MQTERSQHITTLILGVTAALVVCMLALTLATQPAQAVSQRGDLSISQTDSPDPLESGYLTYSLTVKHELVDGCGGSCWSSGTISVTDTLPSGVELIDINSPPKTNAGHSVSCTGTSTITCTIGNLYDGESVDIDIGVRVTTAGAQALTNTATVSGVNPYYPDPTTTNNSATSITQVSESYTPPPGCASVCPNTTITQKPNKFSSVVSPTFAFTSSEANSTFECKMDNGSFQSCSSPKQYVLLSEGQHTFQVRAKNSSGNVDLIPAKYTWTVDSLRPKITFTQRPGRHVGYGDWVTNDRTPSWAWTIADANSNPSEDTCYLYDDTNRRYILDYFSCASSSPYTFGGELPDGHYHYTIFTYDNADNYQSNYNYFEVDTVAPRFVSGEPHGTEVGRYADVVVFFNETVYDSKQFVNIYPYGSTTPVAVYRYDGDGDKRIWLSPKNGLRPGTRYAVKVTTGVNDGANNLGAAKSWSFKTRG